MNSNCAVRPATADLNTPAVVKYARHTQWGSMDRTVVETKYSRINSTKSPSSGARQRQRDWADATSLHGAQIGLRVDQCVSAVRAVEVSVLAGLCNSFSHVTVVGGQ